MTNIYDKLNSKYNVFDDLKFESLVHAQFNKNKPLHRWVHYKEGFSDELIDFYIDKWNMKEGDTLIDPFTGSGTTLLQAQKHNIKSVGFEVNPFSHLMIEMKTVKWSEEDIKQIEFHVSKLKNIEIKKNLKKPSLPRIDDIFEEPYLSELLTYREYIFNIEDEKIHKLFLLAFLSILEYNSNARKFCSGLRYIQRKNKNVKKDFFEKLEMMLEDIRKKEYHYDSNIILGSSLNHNDKLEENSIEGLITSPPYANTFDYTNVYKIELWFGNFVNTPDDIKSLRKKMIRSHVSNKPMEDSEMDTSTLPIKDDLMDIINNIKKEKLWSNHIPRMVWAYFEDMYILLKNMHKLLVTNGKGAIVVANSVYNGYIVPTDLFIAELAEYIGFEVNNIRVGRYIDYSNSNNRRKPLKNDEKYVRESIVEFTKKP